MFSAGITAVRDLALPRTLLTHRAATILLSTSRENAIRTTRDITGGIMKRVRSISLLLTIAMATASVGALADEHDNGHGQENHGYVHHQEWKKGAKMRDEDWRRGQPVDYHERHLRAPPRGHEWREVDGNYVLAAVATGVIASVVTASVARH
jgi:Ni/Co efflux regulator RcnB